RTPPSWQPPSLASVSALLDAPSRWHLTAYSSTGFPLPASTTVRRSVGFRRTTSRTSLAPQQTAGPSPAVSHGESSATPRRSTVEPSVDQEEGARTENIPSSSLRPRGKVRIAAAETSASS